MASAGRLHGPIKPPEGLEQRIDKAETGLGTRIGELRSDIGKLDTRLVAIEQRTYDLSTRLPPAPAAARTSDT